MVKLFAQKKRNRTGRPRLRLLLIILVSLMLFDFCGIALYYSFVQNFIARQKQDFKADAALLFFGDHNEAKNGLGIDSKNRADVALQLFKDGKVNSIIAVGGYAQHFLEGKPNYMDLYLKRNGIVDSLLFSESLSYNTITNWQEAKKIINRNEFNSIVAVSAPLHIYRVSGILDFDTIYYCSYQYRLQTFNDYQRLYNDVHHEWISFMLSAVFKGESRNRVVYNYRKLMKWFKEL